MIGTDPLLYVYLVGILLSFTILDFIQFKTVVTLAYTPGNSGFAHPIPQLTTPAMIALPLRLQTSGPPESPWQASLPPTPGYPAQSIEFVIGSLL